MSVTPEKMEHTKAVNVDKPTPHGNLALLAKAAAIEHALTPFEAMRIYWRAFLWCIFICVGALLWGYDSQIGGALLSVPQFRQDFGYIYQGQPVLPAGWQSAFSSASSIGSMLGGLSLGWFSDRLGRRGAIAVACAVSIVGVLLQFLTPRHNNAMLLVGKLVNGFSLGMYVTCAGAYCVELSPLALRGVTTSVVNLWIVIGIFMTNGVLRGTGARTDAYAYRLPFAVQWIFPVLILIGLPFAPESPWWLMRKGRYEDAERVIVRLGGPTVDAELQREQIRETIELEDSCAETSTYLDCFKRGDLRRTGVAMMVPALQQCTGVVFVLGYSTYFFELAGFGTSKAFDLGVGLTAVGVVGSLVACCAIPFFGRRTLFNWGMVVSTVTLFFIGFTWIGHKNEDAKLAVSAFMMIYNFVFEAGIGPLGYVMFSEVSSAKLRSKTVGIGVFVNSFCTMVSNIVVPYLVNPDEADLGGFVGFIFGGLSFAGSVWAYFFIPETKGRTVDELDLLFERRVSARHFASYQVYDGNNGDNFLCREEGGN